MSHAARRGHTGPRQGGSQQLPELTNTRNAWDSHVRPAGIHPDVWAVAVELGLNSRPRSVRKMQALYMRLMDSAVSDFDFGAVVLTYLTRTGSRAVDVAVGERVTRRLMKGK